MPDPKPPPGKSQIEKFRDLAREIGADDSEEPLNEALRKVARVKSEFLEISWPTSVPDDAIVAVETREELREVHGYSVREVVKTAVRRSLRKQDGTIIGDERIP